MPHTDGTSNAYDVALLAESCASPASNGEFEGLATRTIGEDWGDWLVLWLSTAVEMAPAPQALVMWALRISE